MQSASNGDSVFRFAIMDRKISSAGNRQRSCLLAPALAFRFVIANLNVSSAGFEPATSGGLLFSCRFNYNPLLYHLS